MALMSSAPYSLPVTFLKELEESFPPRFISRDPGDLETYGKDWTKAYAPAPSLIAFPQTTEEVSHLLRLCSRHRVPVVPSGGRTGLSGGAVAARGEVVLSLKKMGHMGEVDSLAQTLRVQAGAVTEAVHGHCAPHGLTWPVDFASKGSSHVGGNISTNAGGVKVIRYGLTRNWVLGLQVVTADGTVLELNGSLEKNQTGLDLRQLFIGSEGTLGVVTEATLKLAKLPGDCEVFFFALQGLKEVLELFRDARSQSFMLNAFELVGDNCLTSVVAHRKIAAPFATRAPYYVLMEIERPEAEDARDRLESWLATLFENSKVLDGVLAQSPANARDLWSLREGVAEAIMAKATMHKHDVSVPIAALQVFTEAFQRKLQENYGAFEVYVFGHIGDGNLHINIAQPDSVSREEFYGQCKEIDLKLFELVQQHQGSISAEHGIGLLKKYALGFSRTPEEIALLKAVKYALDPQGILNPGKIFD